MLLWAYHALFLPSLLLVALLAWWRGEWPERTAAALYVAAWIGTQLLKPDLLHRYHYVEIGVLTVDATLLVALTFLAIRSGRGWLIWATAFQLLSTSAHLGRALNPAFSALAYSILEGAWGYPMLIALALGTLWNPRRSRRKPADGF